MDTSSKFFLGLAAGAGLALLARNSRSRMDFRDKSIVITGARGLALELARVFAEEGAYLTLLARNEKELINARRILGETGNRVLTLRCDVSRQDEVDQAIGKVLERYGSVDVLVNNAGLIQVGPVEEMTLDDFKAAMDIHGWGPLYTMRKVVPSMIRQGEGRIVNISSIGGLVAVPHLLPYVMSKFALTGLSDGMRAELARYGISITTVCPGLMRTGSPVNALFRGQYEKEYFWFAAADSNPLLSMDASKAARRIVEACRYGEARLITTIPAKLLHGMNALLTGTTAAIMKISARLLPDAGVDGGDRLYRGWESRSKTPRWLTYLSDKVITRNNQGSPL